MKNPGTTESVDQVLVAEAGILTTQGHWSRYYIVSAGVTYPA